MATRTINHLEAARLVDYNLFVSSCQSAVMHKCTYLYDVHKEGDWGAMADEAKREFNFSYETLKQGHVNNNTGFARNFCARIIKANAGVYDPEEMEFNDHALTKMMVENGLISEGNDHFYATFAQWISHTDITVKAGG